MPNLFASYLRTLVPIAVGLVLGALARIGLHLDDAAVTTYVTAALTGGYYLAFRGLEALAERMSWRPLQLAAGVLLGWACPPAYDGTSVDVPLRLVLDKQHLDQGLAQALAALERATAARRG